MPVSSSGSGPTPSRELHYFTHPEKWEHWPFLPLVRHHADGRKELGVLCDARGAFGLCGYAATVFLTNLFTLPGGLDAFLALPRETFGTPEEMAAAGWSVD